MGYACMAPPPGAGPCAGSPSPLTQSLQSTSLSSLSLHSPNGRCLWKMQHSATEGGQPSARGMNMEVAMLCMRSVCTRLTFRFRLAHELIHLDRVVSPLDALHACNITRTMHTAVWSKPPPASMRHARLQHGEPMQVGRTFFFRRGTSRSIKDSVQFSRMRVSYCPQPASGALPAASP